MSRSALILLIWYSLVLALRAIQETSESPTERISPRDIFLTVNIRRTVYFRNDRLASLHSRMSGRRAVQRSQLQAEASFLCPERKLHLISLLKPQRKPDPHRRNPGNQITGPGRRMGRLISRILATQSPPQRAIRVAWDCLRNRRLPQGASTTTRRGKSITSTT